MENNNRFFDGDDDIFDDIFDLDGDDELSLTEEIFALEMLELDEAEAEGKKERRHFR